jgi:hypothetical protein
MQKKLQVFAVLRMDSGIRLLEDALTIKEILPTRDEAKSEVERLNKLNASKGARYFWQMTRYFPEGRKPSVKARAREDA